MSADAAAAEAAIAALAEGRSPPPWPALAAGTRRLLVTNRVAVAVAAGTDAGALDALRDLIWATNARSLASAARTSRTLAAAGVRHIVVKGPALGLRLHGDAFLRPSADVDVLTAAADEGRAATALAGLGLMREPGHGTLYWRRFLGEAHFGPGDGRNAPVDLHVALPHPSGRRRDLASAVLSRAVVQDVGSTALPVPEPIDDLLVHAAYLAKAAARFEPAGAAMLDAAAAARRLGPDGLRVARRRAASLGLSGALSLALDPGRAEARARLLMLVPTGTIGRAALAVLACDGAGGALRALAFEAGRKAAQAAAHRGWF